MLAEKNLDEEKRFIEAFKKFKLQWESRIKSTPLERIAEKFLPSSKVDFLDSVNEYFKILLINDVNRRKRAKEDEKEMLDCLIGMHQTTIDMCKLLIDFYKSRETVKRSKSDFITTENFENTRNYFSGLIKEVSYLDVLSEKFREKASFQDKLIFLTKEKYKSPIGNEAVVIDIVGMYLGEIKIPLTTLYKIIHKVGFFTFLEAKSIALQSRRLDKLSKRTLELSKLLKDDLEKLSYLLPKK